MAKKKTIADYAMWTIMALLLVGLMGFGTRQFTQGAQSIGTVGDRELSAQAYARELDGKLNEASAQFGTRLTLQQAQLFGLPQQVLGEMVAQAALDNEDDRIGISVGDARVAREVQQVSGFRGSDGSFDPVIYRAALKRVGLTVREFEGEVRDEIARSVLQSAVAAGIDAPDAATDVFLDYSLSKRDVSILRIGPDQLDAPVAAPSEDELRAYFDQKTGDYTVPETRNITYISLSPAMQAASIEIGDDELRALYDARIAEFVLPERRAAERLVFADRGAAEAALARLTAGEAGFEDLVTERGLKLSDTELDVASQADFGPGAEAVFGLAEVGDLALADTPLGPAIFRLSGVFNARTTSFEDARDGLREEEALRLATDQVAEMASELDDMLVGGATLEEVAAESEAQLATIAWTQESSEGIAADTKFREAAAAAAEGDFPQIMDDDADGIFALRLDGIDPARPQTFEEARAALSEAWLAEKTADALAAKADIIAGELRGGAEMALQPGQFSVLTGQTRTSVGEGLTPEGLKAVFQMEPGEIRTARGASAAYVLRLDAVDTPDLQDPEVARQRDALAASVANSIAQDVFTAYTRALQEEAGVSLNQAAINAVHASFP